VATFIGWHNIYLVAFPFTAFPEAGFMKLMTRDSSKKRVDSSDKMWRC